MVVVGLAWEEHKTNNLQSNQAECYYSVADMWQLRSETRWSDHKYREVVKVTSKRRGIMKVRDFDEC